MLRLLRLSSPSSFTARCIPSTSISGAPTASPLLILLHAWPAKIDRFAWRDAGVNVLLYFPLGLTAVLVLTRRLPRAAAALATMVLGIGLSASIEMLQLFDSTRTTACWMWPAISLGTVAGVMRGADLPAENIRHHAAAQRRPRGRRARCCWPAVGPDISSIRSFRCSAAIACAMICARFLATPISAVEVFAAAAEWFAFALLLRAVAVRPEGAVARCWPCAASRSGC